MRFKEFITEDTLAQQEINALSQAVLNYINSNPQVIKPDGHFELKDIPGLPKFTNPDVARMVEGSVIQFRPDMGDAGGAASSSWSKIDPATGKLTSTEVPIFKAAKATAKASKTGNTPVDFIRSWIKNGGKLTVFLPYDVIVRKHGEPLDNFFNNTLSTISHELNHIYTNVRGRFNSAERIAVDTNKAAAAAKPIVQDILANASDPTYNPYTTNKDAFNEFYTKNHGPGPDAVGKWIIARANEVKYQTFVTDQELWIERNKHILDPAQVAQHQAELLKFKEQIKAYQAQQKTALETIKTIKVNPKGPTEWTHDVYQSTETELSSRFQQVTNDLAEKIKPGATSEQIKSAVMQSFLERNIGASFVDANQVGMPSPSAMSDYMNRRDVNAQMVHQIVYKEAIKNPRFREYLAKAVKFWEAEAANPISKSVEARKTLGDRFKALMLDIPQEYVGKVALPGAKDVVNYQGQKVVNSIEASKGVAGAALWGVQKVLMPVATAYAIYAGLKEIMDLPADLPEQEFEIQATKIAGRLAAEFGIGYVAAIAGAMLAAAAGATAAGIGAAPAALAGFVVGGALGIGANYLLGDTVKTIVGKIVDFKYGRLPQQRQQPTKIQQPPDPPAQKPAPKVASQPALNYESLDRLLYLARN
jgi:hypothetical protein